MALKTFVKIGNISNLSDARYCAGMMVDVLGFNLQPESADYISPESFKEITNWISGVEFAGEFGDLDASSLMNLLPSYDIEVVEITNSKTLLSLGALDQKKIFRINIVTSEDIELLDATIAANNIYCDWISVFCDDSTLFESLDLALAKITDVKLLKGYNINTDSVTQISTIWTGIALEGTPEEQPGFKDFGIVMDVLEVLEEE